MITIINISDGNLILDSMGVVLVKGQRVGLSGSLSNNLVLYPEISLFLNRGRIAVEDTSAPKLFEMGGI